PGQARPAGQTAAPVTTLLGLNRSTQSGKRTEGSPDGAGSSKGRIPGSPGRRRLRPPIVAFLLPLLKIAQSAAANPADTLALPELASRGRIAAVVALDDPGYESPR